MGCATLIAGWFYARSGALSYVAMAGIAAISLAAALRLLNTWNGGALVAQPST
jgi:PPP family 3-phenylpropionic acid transporter